MIFKPRLSFPIVASFHIIILPSDACMLFDPAVVVLLTYLTVGSSFFMLIVRLISHVSGLL